MKLKVNLSTIEHLVSTGCTDLIVEGIKQLEAENARLNDNIDKLCKHGDLAIERLRSENERLRKAGDALVELLKDEDYNTEADEYCLKEVVAWRAAKEGNSNE